MKQTPGAADTASIATLTSTKHEVTWRARSLCQWGRVSGTDLVKNITARTGGALHGSEPPHAQCSALLGARRCGLAQKGGWSTKHDCCSRSGRVDVSAQCRIQRADLNCLPAEEMVFLDMPNWRPTFLMAVERMPQRGPTDADAVGAQVAISGGEVDRVRVAVVGAYVEPDEVAKQPRVQ